ncbi:MAG: tetratricopeptide repeat protein [Gammaproteobacteria bacterium]|nr:tetratricopeptide repeat protein [Gammaproteobacteria bacterium]
MTTPKNPTQTQLEELNRAIALHLRNDLPAAEAAYRALIAQQPRVPDAYSNLARICSASGRSPEAIALCGKALLLDPHHLESLVLLGLALRDRGELEKAGLCYRAALDIKADIPEVLYNLGNLLQEKGEVVEAGQCYRQALSVQPHFPLAHYNLGNSCRDQGRLEDAITHYRESIAQDPSAPLAHNNLGNALMHQDRLEPAIASYQQALKLQPDYPDAMYNLGNALYLMGELEQAQPWFARAGIKDWRARCLYCYYKTEQYDAFARELQASLAQEHTSPQIAALSAHYAINCGKADEYNFCPQPLSHVYHRRLQELSATHSPLRLALLATIAEVDMSQRHQGRLHQGVQSAGNLFLRDEAPLQELAGVIREHFVAYQEHFRDSCCTLVQQFPVPTEFESAWYIRMQQGGHLDAHIHETGWLSGVVYLALPATGDSGNEGALELGLHGDGYPILQAGFPSTIVPVSVGDIVLFPSSLFHRTIPFCSAEERICIAFDLKPKPGRSK